MKIYLIKYQSNSTIGYGNHEIYVAADSFIMAHEKIMKWLAADKDYEHKIMSIELDSRKLVE